VKLMIDKGVKKINDDYIVRQLELSPELKWAIPKPDKYEEIAENYGRKNPEPGKIIAVQRERPVTLSAEKHEYMDGAVEKLNEEAVDFMDEIYPYMLESKVKKKKSSPARSTANPSGIPAVKATVKGFEDDPSIEEYGLFDLVSRLRFRSTEKKIKRRREKLKSLKEKQREHEKGTKKHGRISRRLRRTKEEIEARERKQGERIMKYYNKYKKKYGKGKEVSKKKGFQELVRKLARGEESAKKQAVTSKIKKQYRSGGVA